MKVLWWKRSVTENHHLTGTTYLFTDCCGDSRKIRLSSDV